MPAMGFEPTIAAGERPKTYALDRVATGTGTTTTTTTNNNNNNYYYYNYYSTTTTNNNNYYYYCTLFACSA